jgi:hypothetical protein
VDVGGFGFLFWSSIGLAICTWKLSEYSSTFRCLACLTLCCVTGDDEMASLSLPKRQDRQVCRKVRAPMIVDVGRIPKVHTLALTCSYHQIGRYSRSVQIKTYLPKVGIISGYYHTTYFQAASSGKVETG